MAKRFQVWVHMTIKLGLGRMGLGRRMMYIHRGL